MGVVPLIKIKAGFILIFKC